MRHQNLTSPRSIDSSAPDQPEGEDPGDQAAAIQENQNERGMTWCAVIRLTDASMLISVQSAGRPLTETTPDLDGDNPILTLTATALGP